MPISDNLDCNYIFVAFLVTNTNIGKMIRLVTHNQYNHVTLSFDQGLSRMYSFARYHINSPISGGFVVEVPQRYLIDDKDVMVKICKLPVTQEEYRRIQEEVGYFQENREEMLYNTLNALLSLMKKRLSVKNTYTCLEFVAHVLRCPNIWAIGELEHKLERYVVYTGSFRNIAKGETSFIENDDYFIKRHRSEVVLDTVFHFKKIVLRLMGA